ncbi:hypothetical protein Bca52824_040752 [Brassica carinata]|uniref:Uncharacterized protein n=1 Tax=Brassica carinata TaxID=52824 RepID=A0A8X7RRK0_BRACI|nr:hypothetical protein Bca52824_040752 [Brassica carinata]
MEMKLLPVRLLKSHRKRWKEARREDAIEGGSTSRKASGSHSAGQHEWRTPDKGVSVAKPRSEGLGRADPKKAAGGAKRKKKSSGGDWGLKGPVTGPLKPVIPFDMLEDGAFRAFPPLGDDLLRPAVVEDQNWPNVQASWSSVTDLASVLVDACAPAGLIFIPPREDMWP